MDMADAGITVTKLTETNAEGDVVGAVQGEGTYEPRGSYGSLFPCLAFKLNLTMVFVVCRERWESKSREGRWQ